MIRFWHDNWIIGRCRHEPAANFNWRKRMKIITTAVLFLGFAFSLAALAAPVSDGTAGYCYASRNCQGDPIEGPMTFRKCVSAVDGREASWTSAAAYSSGRCLRPSFDPWKVFANSFKSYGANYPPSYSSSSGSLSCGSQDLARECWNEYNTASGDVCICGQYNSGRNTWPPGFGK